VFISYRSRLYLSFIASPLSGQCSIGRKQRQTACAVALVLEATVAHFAEPAEEDGRREHVYGASPLFRLEFDAPAVVEALQPDG
jgi:hypothetical protein